MSFDLDKEKEFIHDLINKLTISEAIQKRVLATNPKKVMSDEEKKERLETSLESVREAMEICLERRKYLKELSKK